MAFGLGGAGWVHALIMQVAQKHMCQNPPLVSGVGFGGADTAGGLSPNRSILARTGGRLLASSLGTPDTVNAMKSTVSISEGQ